MKTPNITYVLLFVNNPQESGAFYSRLLKLKPVEEHPTFVRFLLPNGVNLGLWSKHTARPPVTAPAGGCEICFTESSDEHVDKLYAEWKSSGIPMALDPIAMDGMSRTFVALDPDGHRIRVLCIDEDENG